MKGALSSKPNYQFDVEGHLVKAAEDEADEATFLRESIVLYVEGQSNNHPADVAASNAPADGLPPETLAVSGSRSGSVHTEEEAQAISEKAKANDSNDPSFSRPTTAEEVEEHDMEEVEEEHKGGYPTRKPRRGR
jgi:hypothetical protein